MLCHGQINLHTEPFHKQIDSEDTRL